MSDCSITPEVVLSKGCWDLSQTRNLFFSTRKYTVNEALESGSIIRDLSEFDTWYDFLQSGKMLMLRVTVGEDTSTGAITGEVGGRQEILGQGEARYSFNVETGCPYTQELETFKGFSGGYLYYMNEGKSVGGILSTTSGEVEPIRLNKVAAIAPKGINNGADINSVMLHVYFDAAQMFDMCVYKTNFRYTALDQLLLIADSDLSMVSTLTESVITDTTGELITGIYTGDDADDGLTVLFNGVESGAYTYSVANNKITITKAIPASTIVEVTINTNADFWNNDYYGGMPTAQVPAA